MRRGAAQPFWIETAAGALFSWHDAPADVPRAAAVILCRPFGYEAQCSQRAYRHLAQRLSDEGFHVLRLDSHGTGDSSGGDSDPNRLSTWVDSIRAGADWARSKLGVEKVALFGCRLGALLALEAAPLIEVDALVLFAPPLSGRAWLREARALHAMVDAARPSKKADGADPYEESAGFLIAGPTVEAIGKLDPLAHASRDMAVLLIARDDLPGGEDRLATKLEARGVEVTLSTTAGYGAMMQQDPHRSIVPDAVWSESTAWLAARYERLPLPVRPVVYSRVATVCENGTTGPVREEALDMNGLFGVLTEPLDEVVATHLPTVVLHNIGVNSHVGPNRMYVHMARRWATLGFRVLRFDTAGLGDSPANESVAENRVYSNGSTDDSRRAMDYLSSTRGSRSFVLMGLCSGAYVSFHSAIADARVVGIVLMNILLFHWKEGDPVDVRKRDVVKSSRFYWRAVFGRDAWVRLFRGNVNVSTIAQGLMQKGWDRARQNVSRALAGEGDVARGFRALLRRGTDVLLIFAADDGGRDVIDTHLGPNAERFRHEQGFRFEIIDGTDHTFSPLWCQETVLSLLTSHLVSRFSSQRPTDAGAHTAWSSAETAGAETGLPREAC